MAKSSRAWLNRHVNDPYVKRSVKEGYRSRAAYKLAEIDDKDKLLAPGRVVVDLGAAPGGWTQIALQRVGKQGVVVGIDLLPIEPPIPGALMLQADFASDEGLAALNAALAGRKVDMVLSDMAPNMSGIALADQFRQFELAELTLEFARQTLQPPGAMLVKVFQGYGFDEFVKACKQTFKTVTVRKPPASRAESAEMYLLAKGLREPG